MADEGVYFTWLYIYVAPSIEVCDWSIRSHIINLELCVANIKGRQMGLYVMVSLWCKSLLTNTKFRIPNLWMNNIKLIWCYIKENSFQRTQGGH